MSSSSTPEPAAGHQDLRAYYDSSLKTIAATADDLRRMTDALTTGSAESPCLLRQCPRHRRLLEVVDEAIAVLEATKGAFRSRQLADLRRRLENFVAEERGVRRGVEG